MITRKTCRVCGGALDSVLDLGEHYVSNFILPGESDGVKSPLELVLCRRCRLVQLKHTVSPESMYRNYWYRSGTNQTMTEALADIANTAETLIHLRQNDAVLDIGCNDGTLLAAYKTGGIFKGGYDPAQNLAEQSRKVADRIIVDFFQSDSYLNDAEFGKTRPKIVTSIAMFYDLEDPGAFVSDIKKVLHPDGLWIVQMSYLPLMLKTNELGNICHEHIEYYSLHSFEYLLNMFDLEVVDVALNDVNGGSIRLYIRNKQADKQVFADSVHRALAMERVQTLRDQESRMRLGEMDPYEEFAFRVERIKNDVVNFIKEQVGGGKKVYVYGASTKGNTLLQYFKLDHNLIAAAAERNKEKWGRLTVGTHIPIVSEEEARKAKPEYFLVLPWHFIEEFQDREKNYLKSGGRFIVPMPYFSLR